MASNLDQFCSRILSLNRGIRYVGIANKEPKLLSSAYRKGFAPLLTVEETEKSILQSLLRMGTRETLENKLGETFYALAMYKKVKRASIPVRRASRITHILMVSFDVEVDHEPIILKEILPALEQLPL